MQTLNLNELKQVAGGTFDLEMAMASTSESNASSSSGGSAPTKPTTTPGVRG